MLFIINSYFVLAAHRVERNRNQMRQQSRHSFPLDHLLVVRGKPLDLRMNNLFYFQVITSITHSFICVLILLHLISNCYH